MTTSGRSHGVFAQYAGGWIWDSHDLDQIKPLLLFFDGIALTVPPTEFERTLEREPYLAVPLQQQGKLVNLDPTDLDPEVSSILTAALRGALTNLDLQVGNLHPRGEITTMSSVHFGMPSHQVEWLVAELVSSGFATQPQGEIGLLDVDKRYMDLVFYLFGQALKVSTERRSPSLQVEPVQFNKSLVEDVDHILSHFAYGRPFPRPIFTQILQELEIPIDLERVTLDEILDFRDQHAVDLRRYMAALKQYSREVSFGSSPDDAVTERATQFADYSADLARKSGLNKRRAGVSIAISAAGAAWTGFGGDVAGAVLAFLSACAGLPRNDSKHEVGPFSYLLKVRGKYGRS